MGDRSVPDRGGVGTLGIVHVQRLLTSEEREAFGIAELADVRGTPEEARLREMVLAELKPEHAARLAEAMR